MGTFGAFLLVIAALIGTAMFFTDPLHKLQNQLRGKRQSEVEAEMQEMFDTESDEGFQRGCTIIVALLVALLYTFLIEPIAVISALINNVGYQPVAYAMLAIVAIGWFVFIRAFTKGFSKKNSKAVIVDGEGKRIEGTIEIDEEFNVGNPTVVALRRIFFALPTFYLWYLFYAIVTA